MGLMQKSESTNCHFFHKGDTQSLRSPTFVENIFWYGGRVKDKLRAPTSRDACKLKRQHLSP